MASSGAEALDSAKEIKNTCPICFESFRIPRYLPCSRTFCHNCLSSYILSTCKSKENPVGFPCPLCRQFVPAPTSFGEPDKWTELIPINKIVQAMSDKKDQFCDACMRADEKEITTDWCTSCLESLCAFCAKAHRRNALTKNHELFPISDIGKVLSKPESSVLCKNHSVSVNYFCVDHEELCCTECVCTKHRKCSQVDEIAKTAERLLRSEDYDTLTREIQRYEDILVKAKTDCEGTMKNIDYTSDKILEECTALRDKVLKHITTVVEAHFTDLARKIKEQKEKLSIFTDTVSDRQLLMAQYSQTLKDTRKTPPPILMQKYLNIKKQFEYVTKMFLYRPSVKLHSEASKELSRILDTFRLQDVQMETDSVPLGSIDFTSAEMKMVCELPDSEGDVFGGCFLENGEIVLANEESGHLLRYRNKKLVKKISPQLGKPWDVVCMNHTRLLVCIQANNEGHIQHYDPKEMKRIHNQCITKTKNVFRLAVSSEFVYAACSDLILKLDSDGNIVDQIKVDENTYSVAVNRKQEIISSSYTTQKVTVMNNSGEIMYSYSHENLRFPIGLDINFSGNIFVAGELSNNIHVLTPKAELLKIFVVPSPRCIKFKENSSVCFVGCINSQTKVYEFKTF